MLIQHPLHTQWYPKNRTTVVRSESVNLALQELAVRREVYTEPPAQEPKLANAFTPLVKASNLMRKMFNDERRPVLNFGVG
jgi:hypothetical protein